MPGRRGDPAVAELHGFIRLMNIGTMSVTTKHATLAIEAFRRFGKGRHRAGLNFGDCFSDALAMATGEPLLFKGTGFNDTDIHRAA